ncbi:MAG TPA: SRPBCC domain-containing protein [Steroidobacteraceae bacterium]|jgi:uncharacterized protein YndB with AHSA1/START domain
MNAVTQSSLPNAAVIVRRIIAAPAEDIFDAWLDAEALSEWMRPGTIKRSKARTEARVGGSYEVRMYGESGEILHHGVYRVIDRPRRLVFTWHSPFVGETETLVTVDFRVIADGGTEVIVTHEQLPDDAKAAHARGWTSGLQHLDEACQAGQI